MRDLFSNDVPADPLQGFAAFWAEYPRRVAKEAARRAWRKLRPDAALLDVILAAVRRQKEAGCLRPEKSQFHPHPATWLNGKRWEDEDGPGLFDTVKLWVG